MQLRSFRPVSMYMGATLVLVLSTIPISGSTAVAEVQPAESNQLRIIESSNSHATGTFARSATTIEFDASNADGRAEAKIVVAGKAFSAGKNIEAGSANWSGNNSVLTEDDRAALSAFTYALNSAWIEPAIAAESMIPAHQDLVVRLGLLLAEAPLHTKLGSYDIASPVERSGSKAIPANASTESCVEDAMATTSPGSAQRREVLARCQESNEDGILYTGCNENAWLVHDYDTHCFLGQSIFVGPASADCMAKCGGGCFVITGYTYDCGDHDQCNREHNSNLGGCSDEFWEADDDFLLSSDQCD
jgi:hypothetical protein